MRFLFRLTSSTPYSRGARLCVLRARGRQRRRDATRRWAPTGTDSAQRMTCSGFAGAHSRILRGCANDTEEMQENKCRPRFESEFTSARNPARMWGIQHSLVLRSESSTHRPDSGFRSLTVGPSTRPGERRVKKSGKTKKEKRKKKQRINRLDVSQATEGVFVVEP